MKWQCANSRRMLWDNMSAIIDSISQMGETVGPFALKVSVCE